MTNNVKKIIYNLFFGIGSQILLLAVGIVIPRLFITSFGSEVNGFLSSVNQVFSYVVLLEAGVGTATLQALYKPVAADDREKINGILAATDRFYRRTGWCYLGCVVILAIVYPIAISSSIPVWQQVAVILVVGSSNSMGYFFHAKFRMLLRADGKTYVFTNAHTLVQLGTSVTKIVMILLGMNIVFVQLGHMLLMALMALFICRYTRKKYPWLDLKVSPDHRSIAQKNAVLVHEISQMIFSHTDVLILTVFTDLKVVSVYAVYNMIVDMISTLIGNIHNSFSFRLGQLYNVDISRYRKVYAAYETCYMAVSMALYCITFLFLLPFMGLYTDGISDISYTDPLLPVLFIAIKILVSGRAIAGSTITYAGHFKKTQSRSVFESMINIVVSLTGVWFFGIYGVLLGTITALLYRTNDIILYVNRRILHQSSLPTYIRWLTNIGLFVLVSLIVKRYFPIAATGYVVLVIYAAVYTVLILAMFIGVNFLLFRKQLDPTVSYLRNVPLVRKIYKKKR